MVKTLNDNTKLQDNPQKCGCGLVHKVQTDNQSYAEQTSAGLIPSDQRLCATAELFKVFGDFTRTKIISYLRTGEHQVDDIARQIGMTKSAVSHQLRVLRQTKIVKHRKAGRSVFYSLDDGHIFEIYDLAIAHVTEE